MKSADYINGLKRAAEIAGNQAAADGRAADVVHNPGAKLAYLLRQERALAIQHAILELVGRAVDPVSFPSLT